MLVNPSAAYLMHIKMDLQIYTMRIASVHICILYTHNMNSCISIEITEYTNTI